MNDSIPFLLESLILSRYPNHCAFALDLKAIKLAACGKLPHCVAQLRSIENIISYSKLIDIGMISFAEIYKLNPALTIEVANDLCDFLAIAKTRIAKVERKLYKNAFDIGKELRNPFVQNRVSFRITSLKKAYSL